MKRSRLTLVSLALGLCLVAGVFTAFSAFASPAAVGQAVTTKKATTITGDGRQAVGARVQAFEGLLDPGGGPSDLQGEELRLDHS